MKPQIRKPRKNKEIRKKYDPDSIKKALAAIEQGMSKKLAAKTFQVPRSTLQFRCKNPDKIDPRPGPPTVLSKEEEESLVKWIILCSKKGFPKRREDLQYSVAKFLENVDRKNPFKENVPGEKWLALFLKRHPEIAKRNSEAVTAASSTVGEKDLKGWFSKIEEYLKDTGDFEILTHPNRIYNGDETNFLLCPKTGTVLAAKGEKNVYEIDRGQAKSAITVMFTFGANGNVTPPMIIFPYKRLPSDIAAKVPSNWGIGLSDNGWMKADLFHDYIKNVFYPYLKKEDVSFPVILFVDGHKTHMTLQVSELCSELQIVLIALYPNSTRILQPADVAAFYPLKCCYKKKVLEWRRENPSRALTKLDFVPILQKAIESGIKPDTIKNGFRACGLYPWNADAINYTKCLGSFKDSPTKTIMHGQKYITRKMFIDVVGLDMIRTLEEQKTENLTKSDSVLKEFWNIFKIETKEQTEAESDIVIDNVEINSNIDTHIDLTNTYMKNYIEEEKDFIVYNCENNLDINKNKENINIEDLEVVLANDKIKPIEDTKAMQAHDEIEPSIISHEVFVHCNEKEYLRKMSEATDIEQNELLDSRISLNDTTDQDKKRHKPLDRIHIKLNDMLVLPKTPKQKGTKDSERVTFVLTSGEWQRRENEKRHIKQEKEEAVKKRKEERELKKNMPKIKLPKKTKKKITVGAVKKNLFSQTKDVDTENNDKKDTPNDFDTENNDKKDTLNDLDTENNDNKDTPNDLDYGLISTVKDRKKYNDTEIEKMLNEFDEDDDDEAIYL